MNGMQPPTNLIHLKRGCPECGKRRISEKISLSNEEFLRKLDEYNKQNNTFWATDEEYHNNRTPMKFICKKDGFFIIAKPSNLFSGFYRCYECDRILKEKELKRHIQNNNLPIEIIGKYINSGTKIKCKCTLCNKEYFAIPNRIFTTNAICRDCAYIKMGINSRTSIDEFLLKLKENNPEIEYIDRYSGMNQRVNVCCKKCGYRWSPLAKSIANDGKGCPNCGNYKGEIRISNFLSAHNISFDVQKTFDNLTGVGGYKLRYDFYLPNHNLLIEYQGIQHEKPTDFAGKGNKFAKDLLSYQQEHDKRKREFAKQNNLELLEIWYYDFENIENILKTHLLA